MKESKSHNSGHLYFTTHHSNINNHPRCSFEPRPTQLESMGWNRNGIGSSIFNFTSLLSRNLNTRERVEVAQFRSLVLHHSPQQHQHLQKAELWWSRMERTIFRIHRGRKGPFNWFSKMCFIDCNCSENSNFISEWICQKKCQKGRKNDEKSHKFGL